MQADPNLTPACVEHDHGSCELLLGTWGTTLGICQCVCHRADVIQRMRRHVVDRQLYGARSGGREANVIATTASAPVVSPPAPAPPAPGAFSSWSTSSSAPMDDGLDD